jgi:hypothetical protein
VLYNSPIDKQEVTLMICGLQYLQDTRVLSTIGKKVEEYKWDETENLRSRVFAIRCSTGVEAPHARGLAVSSRGLQWTAPTLEHQRFTMTPKRERGT